MRRHIRIAAMLVLCLFALVGARTGRQPGELSNVEQRGPFADDAPVTRKP